MEYVRWRSSEVIYIQIYKIAYNLDMGDNVHAWVNMAALGSQGIHTRAVVKPYFTNPIY